MVETALEIQIDDLPPSLNNLYHNVVINGHSRRALSSAAKKWKHDAITIMRATGSRQGWTIAKKVPFVIAVRYYAPNVMMWDLDGKPKLLIDALCSAFQIDDRYLMKLNQEKERSPRPYLRMRVAIRTETP